MSPSNLLSRRNDAARSKQHHQNNNSSCSNSTRLIRPAAHPHEGRDDDVGNNAMQTNIENLQKALAAKKKNVALLRTQVGDIKTQLLTTGTTPTLHQHIAQSTTAATATTTLAPAASTGKPQDAQRPIHVWDENGNSLDRYFELFSIDDQQRYRSRHNTNDLLTNKLVTVPPADTHPNKEITVKKSRKLQNNSSEHHGSNNDEYYYENQVPQLLCKLEESADTIESLIHQEEMSKRTIGQLRLEIRTAMERMGDTLSRGEMDLGDAQAENKRLSEKLCLQSDLIDSLSVARSAVQLQFDESKSKLLNAELEINRAGTLGERLQAELRECTNRVAKVQEDLNTSQQRELQLELGVTRLQYDCNSKADEILTQKRSMERLVTETTCARERNEFLSKELDVALNEIKTRESEHSRIQEYNLEQISFLKEKNAVISEEKQKLESALGIEIKNLQKCNQKCDCEIEAASKEISSLVKQLETMASEKSLLHEKVTLQEEEMRKNEIKHDALSMELREIIVRHSEVESTMETTKSELLILTHDKQRMEKENTAIVESLQKQVKDAVEERQRIEAQLQEKISVMEDSYKSVISNLESDLADKNSMIASLEHESNLRKERNAFILTRASQVVYGMQGKRIVSDGMEGSS